MPAPAKTPKRTSTGAMQIGLAALTQPVQAVSGLGDVNEVIQEGWLLKKRRKRMQGELPWCSFSALRGADAHQQRVCSSILCAAQVRNLVILVPTWRNY